MDDVLGLLGLAVYMTAVVSLACGITFLVVKLSPSKSMKEQQAKESAAAD